MTGRFEMKRRLVVGGLVALTVWPLAHRVLVAAFDLNPWKFYGWAMFCVPNPRTFAALYELTGDNAVPLSRGRLRPEDEQAVRAYAAERQFLGLLARQANIEALAHKLLDEDPRLDRVGLLVTQLTLDSRTARLTTRQEMYVYRR
jgi:hypothetical protein